MGTASHMGIKIKWGGDWDMDRNMSEHKLWDAAHYELDDSEA